MNRNKCQSPFAVSSAALFAVLIFVPAAPVSAKGFFDPVARAASGLGQGISRAASAVGKATGKAVTNTARAITRGAKNTGREVGRGASNTGREIARGTNNTGREIVRGGNGIERFERRTKNNLLDNWRGVPIKEPFRFTLGQYYADSRNVDRGTGALTAFEFVYDAKLTNLLDGPTPVGFFASVSSGERYSTSTSANYEFSTIGVGVQMRRIFGKSLNTSHFYLGSGIGIYGTQYSIDPLGPNRSKKTDYSLGLRFTGGYQFTRELYAQFDLLALDSFRTKNADGQSTSINPSGSGVGIGYRF